MIEPSRVTDLIRTASRLIGVLEREIEFLRAAKLSQIQGLQHDKTALAGAYEAQLRTLAEGPGALETVAPGLRAELAEVIARLRATLAANERALRAARQTTDRILRIIADEFERQCDERAAYAATGEVTGRPRKAPGPALSVAYDERL